MQTHRHTYRPTDTQTHMSTNIRTHTYMHSVCFCFLLCDLYFFVLFVFLVLWLVYFVCFVFVIFPVFWIFFAILSDCLNSFHKPRRPMKSRLICQIESAVNANVFWASDLRTSALRKRIEQKKRGSWNGSSSWRHVCKSKTIARP